METKTKFVAVGDHHYGVTIDGHAIGSVRRFGSLPSMQGWIAFWGEHQASPRCGSRAAAVKYLIADHLERES